MFNWLMDKLNSRFGILKGSHRQLGARGEKLARRYLRRSGMKLLGRNYRSEYGEIDILALDGDCVVFCEVKSRSSFEVDPASAITPERRRRYKTVARHYMSQRKTANLTARFDVIFVNFEQSDSPEIQHIRDAFT